MLLAGRVVATIFLALVVVFSTSRIASLDIVDPLGPKALSVLFGIGLVPGALLLTWVGMEGSAKRRGAGGEEKR